jgi:hypothetical protein
VGFVASGGQSSLTPVVTSHRPLDLHMLDVEETQGLVVAGPRQDLSLANEKTDRFLLGTVSGCFSAPTSFIIF